MNVDVEACVNREYSVDTLDTQASVDCRKCEESGENGVKYDDRVDQGGPVGTVTSTGIVGTADTITSPGTVRQYAL